jgi:asparagine synthase (glutamine-hydrolysing)
VDRIRSIPLFYGKADGQVYLSDDAEWVRQQVGDKEMDPVARDEFQLAGYVTGQDTLFPNVKQVQAGELLRITLSGKEPQIETYRYYRFTHTEPSEWDEPTLREELDRVTEASIRRLIKYADGRQIVVPLSGGYDSRLIVTMLKRLGYNNILAFTYGVPGNRESEYSKKVADALGIKWHFVEYSKELWRQAWQTDERLQYQKWGSGWSSIPHVQDWLAVKRMKQEKAIDTDCIFVPGHTGDFISGGHLPDIVFVNKSLIAEDLCEAILKQHYGLAPFTVVSQFNKSILRDRILLRTEKQQVKTNIDVADGFEKWEWQERQSKFICNSVRVYENFDYDWWLPLWDAQFMRFWESVPLSLREGRKWYVRWVKDIFKEQANINGNIDMGNSKTEKLKKAINNSQYLNMTKSAFNWFRFAFRKMPPSSHLAGSGRYPEQQYWDLVKRGYSSNGIAAYFFSEMVQADLTIQDIKME